MTTGESGGKRYWDSTNWISLLAEDEAYRADICQNILNDMVAGELTVITSAWTLAEVIRRRNSPNFSLADDQKITDFLIQITLLVEGEAPFSNTEQFVRLSAILAVAWAVLSCGLTTLAAIMYNLVADVVGGVEIVLLEENVVPVMVTAPPFEPAQVGPSSTPGQTETMDPDQPTMVVETS